MNRTCQFQPMKDDLSAVALGKLVERQTAETDQCVLTAFSVSQVCEFL